MNLENFKQRVAYIRAGLVSGGADWKDINEATVRQVIALPLLQAAGFDIWDPAEVKPEVPTSSGGRVDVWLNYQGTTLYILELKKLNLNLKDKETEQAINYAASQAVKWAMATNGLEWKLFDTFDVNKKSIEREVLTVSLHEAEYLFDLLSMENWKNGVDVVGLIEGKRARIKQIEKVRKTIQEEIEYTYDETGEFISEKIAIHNLKRSGKLKDEDIQIYLENKNVEYVENVVDVEAQENIDSSIQYREVKIWTLKMKKYNRCINTC